MTVAAPVRSLDATAEAATDSSRFSRAAWLRALALTAPIDAEPERTFPRIVDEMAARFAQAPALIDEVESLTYAALADRVRRYRRWAEARSLGKGDVVCVMLPNCADYVALWLALTGIGAVAALVNASLTGAALVHAIRIAPPTHMVVDRSLAAALCEVKERLEPTIGLWVLGSAFGDLPALDWREWEPAEPDTADRPAPVTLKERALLIYTSGTTGLPKAANVSHRRVMQWTHWFAGLMNVGPDDRMYDCLPMYHSVGGIVAVGAMLAAGGSVVLRRRFSASRFWDDVVQSDCTLFQYIGELCRYLVNTAPQPGERAHRLRLCCGNGLRGDVWPTFRDRFAIPRIIEFYAATEGTFSLYNCEGEPGAIGRIPPFLRQRSDVAIVRFDFDREQPLRGADGRCVPCGTGEIGEAIGRIDASGTGGGSRFEGYADPVATERKILRDVFAPGDRWVRTGDLMRKDGRGFFYFVDRVGDTFRWKGENVSSEEVAQAISGCPGVERTIVYGVAVPDTEGRAGMAALVVGPEFDLAAFRRHLAAKLPDYARPLFLRLCTEIETTGTFKPRKDEYVRAGFDPSMTRDPIYLDDADAGRFVRVDPILYEKIAVGAVRV